MANVNVRLPNCHWQKVKITPNTVIIQILDEICEKCEIDPEDYDLRFQNRVLDLSSTFRFSGVPNNANLELTKCIKPRLISNLTVRLHVEGQDFKVGVFAPTVTLMEIIENLAPDAVANIDRIILLYAQRTFSGETDFKSTTLRKLGLFKGQVIFRLRICDVEQLSQQAHVYKPISRICVNESENSNSDVKVEVAHNDNHDKIHDNSQATRLCDQGTNNTNSNIDDKQKHIDKEVQEANKEKEESSPEDEASTSKQNSSSNSKIPANSFDPVSFIRKEKKIYAKTDNEEKEKDDIEIEKSTKEIKESKHNEIEVNELIREPKIKERKIRTEETEEKPIIRKIYLGERNALVYNKADIKAAAREEVPDSFYNATLDDVRKIYKHHQTIVKSQETMPLMTSRMRQSEDYVATFNLLSTCPKSVIRIFFPNQLVLQGVFRSIETVQTVYDFVKMYLKNSEDSFQLYKAPPRKDLDLKSRLFEENLVPLANIYYSGSSELKDEVKSQLSSYEAAELDAIELRHTTKQVNEGTIETDVPEIRRGEDMESESGSSGAQLGSELNNIQSRSTMPSSSQANKSNGDKVPNWFTKGLKKL